MNDQTDSQLLGAWAKTRSEPAFAELVRRHVDFVHSAALRMVCDSHLAKDVTQSVFVALARDAARITDCRVLAGWLHRTAQNIAAQTVRADVRRRAREQEAATMNELLADSGTGVSPAWSEIAPHLDAALGELSEPDRDAVLLRYFENKSLREVGQALGTSDDTAQKRVSRAVERLREFLAKRGVTVGASGLVVVISANAVQAAPVGLAVTISTAVTLGGTTIAATATATATKAIAMTTLQKSLIGATLAAAVGTGIYEARQASNERTETKRPFTLPSRSFITIEPGVSIGPVHSGMKQQDVVVVLGEPNNKQDGVLNYYDLGIALLPRRGGFLELAICFGGSEPFKPFAGHTREGIGIGSSRAEVIKAYGEPTTIELGRGVPEHSTLVYKSRGINFHIREDKVYKMAVFLKP